MRYLILSLPLVITACATTGSSDGITIETTSQGHSVQGANCVVSSSAGTWNVITPATVAAGSGGGDLRVVCDKDGYRTSEVLFRGSSYPSGSSVGLGVGGGSGNVGVGVGLNFPITGSRGSYPSRITVDLNPK